MTSPRLLIVGPGAMGCGMAALLQERGANVALLDYRPERAREIERRGVRVEQEGRARTLPIRCSAVPRELGTADLVIVLVKSYNTREAARHVRPCVGAETAVLTLQNGLGNYEALGEVIPPQQVLAGTIVMGCTLLGVGSVRISGVGEMVVGSPSGNYGLAEQVAQVLGPLWSEVRLEADIEAALWRKAIINAAVNPLTALTGLPNGALLEHEDLRQAAAAISREGAAAAQACKVCAFDGDPVPVVEEVCRLTAENQSSMLQDVLAGRQTEVDAICGEIARRARAAGAQAPLCEVLRAVVAHQLPRGPSHGGPAIVQS